jgi:RNA polymerase primary sigma factor
MEELNKVLPSEEVTPTPSKTRWPCSARWASTSSRPKKTPSGIEGGEVAAARDNQQVITSEKPAAYDRTDDPVRMYLREMGSVELLSREGEIAIAKRIEAGRDTMIRACAKAP